MLIASRYRLLDLVGRGGMGRVWRARDEMLHREVAVKQIVPPTWLADDERAELRSRTLREARTAARLNHPNVVRLYDVVQVDDEPWIVMEYVPSHTLQDVLDREGPLAPRRAARVGLALLAALRAAHAAGVLHRDVKPQNVLVAHDGRVMLTDFGLAVFDGGDGAMTRPGMVLGSPQYVAPERAAEGVSSVEADLWSLGATLHAAVEGRSPYARSTAMATLTALATAPPDPAPHAGPLAPVLVGLLRRDPGDRIDHEEAGRRLTAAAAHDPGDGPAPVRPDHDAPTTDAAGSVSGSGAVDGDPTDPLDTSGPRAATGSTGDPAATPDALGPAAAGVTARVGNPASGRRRPGEPAGPPETPGRPAAPGPAENAAPGPVDEPAPPPAGGLRPVSRRPRDRRVLRRAALVATALLVAAAAGVGTALAVTDDGRKGPDTAGRSTDRPPDDRTWGHPPNGPGGPGGPGPDGPPPPGGHGVPPPPFPCVRPDAVGQPVPSGTPAPGERFRPPGGWAWHTDAGGFRLALPAGWRYSREGGVACFQDPATGRALSVAGPDSGDPLGRLRGVYDRAADAAALPGYHEVRLGPADGDTVWELQWDAPYGARIRAELRVPGSPSGAGRWTLGWITTDPDWTAAAADWSTVRASFRPH
ncbi:protein kinase [Micromonospora sp. WMMD812]|uniref:serine/threonine-protein kinase n=1 Tax=Micromonospora sp. WMMD812 TaxID=3015152 RepID=UPI0032B2C761